MDPYCPTENRIVATAQSMKEAAFSLSKTVANVECSAGFTREDGNFILTFARKREDLKYKEDKDDPITKEERSRVLNGVPLYVLGLGYWEALWRYEAALAKAEARIEKLSNTSVSVGEVMAMRNVASLRYHDCQRMFEAALSARLNDMESE